MLRDGLATDTGRPAGIYFGTRGGKLYASRDEGDSWQRLAEGLPPVSCVRAAVVEGGVRPPHARPTCRPESLVVTVTVRLPGHLRPFCDGRGRVILDGPASVAEALHALPAGVRERILDEQGSVRPHVNVFVERRSIRETGGLATPLSDGAEVFVIPAVSGGAA